MEYWNFGISFRSPEHLIYLYCMFVNYLINIVLALIMFAIGSSLKFDDFAYVFNNPKRIVLGLLLQMLFLPLLAFLILFFSNLDPVIKVGLFIVSLCPGGTTSNFISYITKVDTALSISLTSINSFLILISIPLFTNIALKKLMHQSDTISLSFIETAGNIVLVILLPVFLGLLFNHYFSSLSLKIQNPLKWLNVALLAIMFGIKFFASEKGGGSGITIDDVKVILPYAFGIHIVAILSSYLISKYFTKDLKSSITIAIEVGLQNTTLALMVTGTILNNNEMTKPALVYAIFSFFTTLGFAYFAKKHRWFFKKSV